MHTFFKESKALDGPHSFLTVGKFDLSAIYSQAKREGVEIPTYFRTYINLKKSYRQSLNKYDVKEKFSIKRLLEEVGIHEFDEIHPLKNILALLDRLLESKFIFKII